MVQPKKKITNEVYAELASAIKENPELREFKYVFLTFYFIPPVRQNGVSIRVDKVDHPITPN